MNGTATPPVLLVAHDIDNDTLDALEKALASLDQPPLSRTTLHEWLEQPAPDTRLLCLLSDAEIRLLLSHEQVGDWQIAILPLKSNRNAQASFGVPSQLAPALKGALTMEKPTTIDLLSCNDEILLGTLIIGNVWGLQSNRFEEDFWLHIRTTLRNLGSLHLQGFSITTAKGQEQDLAAMGVMVFGHNFAGVAAPAISSDLALNDGKLNALVVAPTSVMSHLWFLLKLRLLRRISLQQLPGSVGFIRTQSLTITSQRPQSATLDGTVAEGKAWVVDVKENAANVFIGKRAQPAEEDSSRRDALRTTHLPSLATSRMLRDKALPMFPHAAEADFRELFSNLRESAKTSSAYINLMILSTLLACTGMFMNSAPVLIGAMLLAPMMSPIISLAMGIARTDQKLVQTSMKTLLWGLLVTVVCSALFALFTPLQIITPEIDSRLHPSLLDLAVALLSGVAGAYASAKEEVAKTLVGVAIAVALVPPVAVMGFGIGWMEPQMVWSASLLFLTNLVGIMLAASCSFLILGFAPLKRARKPLLLSIVAMVLIAIPLGLSFGQMVEKSNIHLIASALAEQHPEDGVFDVQEVIVGGELPLIRLQIRVAEGWHDDMLARHKARIEERLGRKVLIEFLVVYVR